MQHLRQNGDLQKFEEIRCLGVFRSDRNFTHFHSTGYSTNALMRLYGQKRIQTIISSKEGEKKNQLVFDQVEERTG